MPADGHLHHRHRHGPEAAAGDRRLALAVAVNLLLTLLQIAGGVIAGSLALVADAVHNLSDALSLAIALLARRITRWPAHHGMTFGYGRAELVAALVNLTTLVAIGLYLVAEALVRLVAPPPIDGWMVVWVAAVALAVDLATALLTHRLARTSVNVRAAFLHNVADALGSLAVIVAGAAALLWQLAIVDPLVTLLIAGYILVHAGRDTVPVVRMLMGGTPAEIELAHIEQDLLAIPGVRGVHHLHVWALAEHELSLEAHIVIPEVSPARMEAIKAEAKRMLRERWGIAHTTLEMEFEGEVSACEEYRLVAPH
ncbi:Cadmium, cobalt and zinc/H(+)-K(+) antiporter [bacterium HR40]|nr:Cadmium, cobalt and zinc/H(+)-K(+) antiporter [bacterium HR40]